MVNGYTDYVIYTFYIAVVRYLRNYVLPHCPHPNTVTPPLPTPLTFLYVFRTQTNRLVRLLSGGNSMCAEM